MMHQQGPDLEQRLSKLEAQLDRFSLTLHQWQQTQEHLQPMEGRLSQLMQQCGAILDRWTVTDQRHAQAVEKVESRLHLRLNQLSGDLQALVAELRNGAGH